MYGLSRFAQVLPRFRAKEVSPRDAAQEMGISVRSFKRYAERLFDGLG